MSHSDSLVAEPETTRYTQTSWDLSALLPDASPAAVGRRLEDLQAAVEEFATHRSELTTGLEPRRFVEQLHEYERVIERMTVLGAYASLRFSADTEDEEALALRNRVGQRLTDFENRLLFLPLWWKELTAEEADRLLPGPDEPDLRHWLEDLRRMAPFTLDEPREQLIRLKDTDGIEGLMTVYSMLTNRLEFQLVVDGEEQTLTRDALMSHVHAPDAEVREAAYRELFRVFEREAPVLRQIYVHRVRDWANENVRLRGVDSPLAVRNLDNDIPDPAVEALLDVARERSGILRRYFRWKASRLSGSTALSRFDLYAPLADSDRRVPYEEAVETVLTTFEGFDPRFAELAERVFAESHIDSELRHGKKGGAFCATVLPSQTPWLLTNYTGRVRDVATLAHELGHAVHSLLAADHSILTQHASLPLAETASVFTEILLTERLLEREEEPAVRRELLATALDDIYATVLRQAWFVDFERRAHEAIGEGASASDLDAIYLSGLEEQFGEAVKVPEIFRYEWVSIPHIYRTPFYCYAYSFGQLLVLSLFQRYRQEGKSFLPGYLALLAHGGSARPAEILAEVGVDPTQRDFWRDGFREIERLVDRIERID